MSLMSKANTSPTKTALKTHMEITCVSAWWMMWPKNPRTCWGDSSQSPTCKIECHLRNSACSTLPFVLHCDNNRLVAVATKSQGIETEWRSEQKTLVLWVILREICSRYLEPIAFWILYWNPHNQLKIEWDKFFCLFLKSIFMISCCFLLNRTQKLFSLSRQNMFSMTAEAGLSVCAWRL